MEKTAERKLVFTGEACRLADPNGRLHPWMLTHLMNLGLVPHQKVGRTRVIAVADIPKVTQACVDYGYLTTTGTEAK